MPADAFRVRWHRLRHVLGEAAIPVAAIGFAAMFLITIAALPEAAQRFPIFAGSAIIALGVLTLGSIVVTAFRRWKRETPEHDDEEDALPRSRRVGFWSFWALLVLWPFAVINLGFYSSAVVAIMGLSLAARQWSARPSRTEVLHAVLRSVLLTAVLVAAVYLIVGLGLGIRLPSGLLL